MSEPASLRTTFVPVEHVLAEIAAFPLGSVCALESCVTALQPRMHDRSAPGAKGTSRLWRACETEVLRAVAGMSVDEIVAFRDRMWFGDYADGTASLGTYLRRLAAGHLKAEGSVAKPRLGGHPSAGARSADEHPHEIRSRRAWRWLSFAMPPDLLLASLPRVSPGPTEVRGTAPNIERMLADRGFPECHMHLGAGMDFRLIWVSCMQTLLRQDCRDASAFCAPGATFDEGSGLYSWLLRAAVMRCLLAAFVAARMRSGIRLNLATFLQRELVPQLERKVGASGVAVIQRALHRFSSGLAPDPQADPLLAVIYGQIATRRQQHSAEGQHEPDPLGMQAFDPIATWLPPRVGGRITPEMRLIREGLELLEQPGQEDPWLLRLFWQTVRVRCIFYRHIVQRPLTPGLQSFVRFYGRIWAPRRSLSKQSLMLAAARGAGYGHGLRSLEVRTSGPGDWGILREMGEVEHASARLGECETGVVVHFARIRGGGAESGTPNAHGADANADPSPSLLSDPSSQQAYRFARHYGQLAKEANSLARLLWTYPMSLLLIRGIDTCTDEVGVPTWVIAPLFRFVRAASGVASRHLRSKLGRSVPPVRSAPHAGEDFAHLMGGLRRLDDTIVYLGLQQGDRIGHGLALGIDPARWAHSISCVELSREERLWDLLWEYRVATQDPEVAKLGRVARLLAEIERLSTEIFTQPVSALALMQLLDDLHDEQMLRCVGFPHGPIPARRADRTKSGRPGRLELLLDYLTDRGIYQRGRITEAVDPRADADAMVGLQSYLRRKVATVGITIEVNPTSNLLVGDIGDLTNHPLWRLHPPRGRGKGRISVCIGSDDPVTFASRLPEEYARLHDALVSAGVGNERANQWLERVRSTGMDARFTLPQEIVDELYGVMGTDRTNRSNAWPFGGMFGLVSPPKFAPLP